MEACFVICEFPLQGETPASLIATVAVKGAVAPRNPLNDPEVLVKGRLPGSVETAGVDSISTRLAALQAKLSESGKIKKSKSNEARLPYRDA